MPHFSRGLSACYLVVIFFCSLFWILLPSLWAATQVSGMDPAAYPEPNVGCLATGKCHSGIEPIRAHDSQMAKQIYAMGSGLGDPNGCVVCHGGNPREEKDAKIAHTGAPEDGKLNTFVVHSGSVWVNEKICGQCHKEWTYAQYRSIMQTEPVKFRVPYGVGALPVQDTRRSTETTTLQIPTDPSPFLVRRNINPIPRH